MKEDNPQTNGRWNMQAGLAEAVHTWLLRHFEGGWATNWALKKTRDGSGAINILYVDKQEKKKKILRELTSCCSFSFFIGGICLLPFIVDALCKLPVISIYCLHII
jgi:hypothetical protein